MKIANRVIGSQLTIAILMISLAGCGKHQGPGEVTATAAPNTASADKAQRQAVARTQLPTTSSKQILFGDLHVHTTFSPDAFITAMPLQGGDGLHPPADACDFARFCSALDFWSINDHAEGITPQRWLETRESIRQCNDVISDPANPDTVAFLGWEWSQVNPDRNKHYGHKNVIFLDTEEGKVPTRSIAAPREQLGTSPVGRGAQIMLGLMDFGNRDYYLSINRYYQEIADTPVCPKGVDARELPEDCLEVADNPQELFTKLDQWGFDNIVIPHGNAWGMNTPPATTFDKQLNRKHHNQDTQTLFEVYSGHGNSEEYRNWQAVSIDDAGNEFCPEPSAGFLPCCWRAGEIIRERCDTAGEDAEECQAREVTARKHYVDAGISGHLTVPGQQVTDWLNCGQCDDCYNPAMDHRPGTTAQYALAITNFDDPANPLRYRFGLMGSSDNHRGRGGTGYKELERRAMTEVNGPLKERSLGPAAGDNREPVAYSVPFDRTEKINLNNLRNMERQASFFMTGGLVAVHSEGRHREAIWNGLKQKEVYATSGDRILLWFDLLQPDETIAPMGSETVQGENPRFRATAAGAFKQKPGCPDYASESLGADRLQALCRNECYHPSDERKRISRIEIVRIQPQASPSEDVAQLIEDPWRSFDCEPNPAGCTVEFEDPDFTQDGRNALYYARAIQAPSPSVNGGQLRCEYDANGQCIKVNPCYGDYRTESSDDCLSPDAERAWSSPIYVDYQAVPN
ncbi:MAG: DUF3604 domain-containing protein [Pseudomonadales bacterium]